MPLCRDGSLYEEVRVYIELVRKGMILEKKRWEKKLSNQHESSAGPLSCRFKILKSTLFPNPVSLPIFTTA